MGVRGGGKFSPTLLLEAITLPGRAYILEALANPRQHGTDRICLHAHRPCPPFHLLLLPPVIPSRPPRTRSPGEQASETPPLQILYGRGAIRFLGSDYATARLRSSTSSTSASPSSSPCLPTPTVPPPRNLKPRRRPRGRRCRRHGFCLAYWRV